jgi:ABC-type dipeptide/oligopeptide/nickel transport system permease subunit
MVAEGGNQGYIATDPRLLSFPDLAIGLRMLRFSFLGDGLGDALDLKGNRNWKESGRMPK